VEVEAGLRRVVVDTPAGPVVARVGRPQDGEVVVLLHGAAGSWRDWLPLLRAAETAGLPIRNAVAVDLPGWGESPDPVEALDAGLAAEVVAAVARSTGATGWTLVGHSLGGLVALSLAAREPSATRGVLLISPSGRAVLDAIRRPVRGGVRLPWFAGMLLVMRVLALLPGGGRPLLRAVGRTGVLALLARPLLASPHSAAPEVLAAFGNAMRPAAFVRAAEAARTVRPEDWRAVRCPVVGVRGSRDVFVGRRDAAGFAGVLPGYRETRVTGAGHFALAERPDAVLRALDELQTPV
jgi:pimeloyl-ACP methyl ester carboxylesterase